ncbi:hypothetical protein QTN25_009261 [Entamoeba marina]
MEVPFEESNPLYNYPVTEALMSNKTIQKIQEINENTITMSVLTSLTSYLLTSIFSKAISLFGGRPYINSNGTTFGSFPNHDISIITSSMFLSSLMLCSIWNKVKQSSTMSFVLVLIPQIFTCLIVLDKLRCYQADYTDALGGLLLGGLFGGLSFASLFRLE